MGFTFRGSVRNDYELTRFQPGSNSRPSIAFVDTTTGLYLNSSGTVGTTGNIIPGLGGLSLGTDTDSWGSVVTDALVVRDGVILDNIGDPIQTTNASSLVEGVISQSILPSNIGNNTSILGGRAQCIDGSAATPSIGFSNVSGTGLYVESGNVSFSSNGTGTMRVTETGLYPQSNGIYDLGSPSAAWGSLYLSGNTLYLGNTVLKDQDGALVLGDSVRIGNVVISEDGDDIVIPNLRVTGNVVSNIDISNVVGLTDALTDVNANSVTANTLVGNIDISNVVGLTDALTDVNANSVTANSITSNTISGDDATISGNVICWILCWRR
jgi:hypothetical protein